MGINRVQLFLKDTVPSNSKHAKLEGESKVIIHPDDALKRGISKGQIVKVYNNRGAFQVPAMLSDITRQGVVVAPMGYWRKINHANNTINAATAATYTDMGHAAAVGDSLVEVEPVNS